MPNAPMTKAEFEALSPREKGYVVYMAGKRDDQPNIPSKYFPDSVDQDEYDSGQFVGTLEAQDEG